MNNSMKTNNKKTQEKKSLRKKINKQYSLIVLLLASVLLMSLIIAYARVLYVKKISDTKSPKYYIGSVVNTGKDNGFSKTNIIEEKDPHYGWVIGKFFVDGHSSVSKDVDSNPIFLKNVGDMVTLKFNLEQDINALNGNENLTINEDENGYDEYFEIEKSNFGRGTLIVKYKDYNNKED